MANRQVTVLNPAGYQELLQTADTLVVEGDVNMNSNLIGGLPAPVSDNDAARKKYIDDAIANVNVDLQGVTDNGNTTTNSISAAGATFTGDVTVGVDGTGHDVKFFGATAGKYCLWDESADNLTIDGSISVTGNSTFTDHANFGGQITLSQTGGNSILLGTGAGFYQTVNPIGSQPVLMLDYNTCELYYEGDKKLETTATGVDVEGTLECNVLQLPVSTGTGYKINLGSDSDAKTQIYQTQFDGLVIQDLEDTAGKYSRYQGQELRFGTTDGSELYCTMKEGGAVELYYDDVKKFETTSGGVYLAGTLDVTGVATFDGDIRVPSTVVGGTVTSKKLIFDDGANNDYNPGGLEISYKGAGLFRTYGSMWQNFKTDTGNFGFESDQSGSGKSVAYFKHGGACELYYDGDKAFETDAAGVSVYANSSTIPGLDGRINFGNSGNCRIEIYDNNAANSAINNNTFKIYSQHGGNNTTKTSILYDGFFDQVWRTSGSASGPTAELGRVNYDGGWELNYHDIQGSQGDSWAGTTCIKKLETTSGGVDVTGDLTVSGEVTADSFDIASLPVLP